MGSQGRSTLDIAKENLMGDAGLIHFVKELLVWPGEPRLHFAASIVGSLEELANITIPGNQGAVGFTWEEAACGAIGETIERYCGAVFHWDDMIYSTQKELGVNAIGMDQFALYTEDVYKKGYAVVPWDPKKPCHWVEAKSLMTGEKAYFPACMVYVPYFKNRNRESDYFAVSVSSGQACHTDRDKALLSGLCEIIERDAFMITWMRRIPPKRVEYKQDPAMAALYQQYFESSNLELHVFDITLDIKVPTMFCVAAGEGLKGPFIAVGASTRPAEREALIKAMKESVQGAAWARELMWTRADFRVEPDYGNIVNFEDHVRLYCEPEMLPHMDFILRTHRTRLLEADPGPKPPRREVEICLEQLKAAGLEAFVVDLTTPEIAELGFYVPKVVVPGLTHLTAIHRMPALATPRYYQVPEKLGLCEPIHRQFNPTPHPFP
jgi:ribosomal protein S12 methylthiotransferase accessory factor